MKKIIYKIFITFTAVLLFAACKKEGVLTYLDVVRFPADFSASTNDVIITQNNTDSSVITFSWSVVTFKIDAPVAYKLQLDVPADTLGSSAWSNAVSIDVGSDVLSKSFNGGDLNTIAISQLGLVPDSLNTIVARVVATLDRTVYSNVLAFKIKPFKAATRNVLWVPGEYQGWDPATAPEIAEAPGRPKMYEGYYYMPGAGPKYFKITSAQDWNHINYGDGGNGSFSTDGAAGGLFIPDGGYYQVTADLNTNKWTATKTTWSIIGDATPGGWGSDTQMTYDPVSQVWKVTADMKSGGSFKFRANNEWVIDFGVDSDKKLVYADHPFFGYTAGLDNLSVPSDGNYTITLDLHISQNYTYELKKN
jgi:hypothetical protein